MSDVAVLGIGLDTRQAETNAKNFSNALGRIDKKSEHLGKTTKSTTGSFIKGQIVGPITFAGSLVDKTGKTALYNTEIMDVIVKGLAMKALWIVRKMSAAEENHYFYR